MTNSIIYRIGTFIEPVTMFFGLPWQLFMAFVASAMGKESALGVMASLFNTAGIWGAIEGTSAVDTATEAKIREELANKLPDMTKIVIAQRISSVKHADQIIILDRGKVAAIGTHETLLANNRIYQEIYESQKEGVDL